MILLATVAALIAPAPATCSPACHRRVMDRHYKRQWVRTPAPVRSHLRAIARCESGGDHRAVSQTGAYRGLLQFDYGTWASVGGRGDPARASRWEQWARGARLYRQRGPQPWPVCG